MLKFPFLGGRKSKSPRSDAEDSRAPGTSGRRGLLSDAAYRRLTLAHTIIFLLAVLAGAGAVIKYREKVIQRIEGLLYQEQLSSRVLTEVSEVLNGPSATKKLPEYNLLIDPLDLRDIHVLSQRLVEKRVMRAPDKKWYSATFVANDRRYKVKVRLRGDLWLHWGRAKKSWRVKFRKDDLFDGYREINFVIPGDKHFETEQIAYDLARKSGLLVSDSGFAEMRVNDIPMGLYFWFEQRGPEMLEKLRYPEGAFYAENNFWLDTYSTHFGLRGGFDRYPSGYNATLRKDGAASLIHQRWSRLLRLVRDANFATFEREAPYLLDLKKLARWNAITWLFGSRHAQSYANVRWYYDTSTGLFEPILYDVAQFSLGEWDGATRTGGPKATFESGGGRLGSRIMRSRAVQRLRNEYLWQMLHDDAYDAAALIETKYAEIRPYLVKGVNPFTLDDVDRPHRDRVKVLKDNRTTLTRWLEYARVFVDSDLSLTGDTPQLRLHIKPDSLAELELKRITLRAQKSFPSELEGARVTFKAPSGDPVTLTPSSIRLSDNELTLTFDNLRVWAERNPGLRPLITDWLLTIALPSPEPAALLGDAYPAEIRMDFVNSLSGQAVDPSYVHYSGIALEDTTSDHNSFFQPASEFIAESGLPFEEEEGFLVLRGGTYDITRDLVLPAGYGLALERGVTLRLGPGANIVSYGPVQIRGTAEQLVRIEALDPERPWGVFGVVKADAQSTIEYLLLSGGSENWVNGIFFSGQLAFHSSDVRISNSVITGARADDALNIKRARFEISNSRIHGNVSDGFDGDWVTGTVRDSVIENNGGDGLDFSGSQVVVIDTRLSNMGDKALSVGEKTSLLALNNLINDSVIGVASKDLSDVRLHANVVYQNETGLALYRKKQIFGGGAAQVMGGLFWLNKKDFSLDKESRLSLLGVGLETAPDDDRIQIKDLRIADVASLYTFDDAGNPVLRAGADGTPFAAGPVTSPEVVMGISLPDLSKGPLGLIQPLARQ